MQCTQVEKGIPATWEYTEPENKRIVFIQFITIFSTKFWKKYITYNMYVYKLVNKLSFNYKENKFHKKCFKYPF